MFGGFIFFFFTCLDFAREEKKNPRTTRVAGPTGLGATGVLGPLNPRRSQHGGKRPEDVLLRR